MAMAPPGFTISFSYLASYQTLSCKLFMLVDIRPYPVTLIKISN